MALWLLLCKQQLNNRIPCSIASKFSFIGLFGMMCKLLQFRSSRSEASANLAARGLINLCRQFPKSDGYKCSSTSDFFYNNSVTNHNTTNSFCSYLQVWCYIKCVGRC